MGVALVSRLQSDHLLGAGVLAQWQLCHSNAMRAASVFDRQYCHYISRD